MGIRSIPGLTLARAVTAHLVAWLIRAANGAGVLGVLLGAGESVPGHVGDYAMALPNGLRAVEHYLHGGRHVDQLARTVAYLNEEAPTVDELRGTMAGTRSWLNRFDLARGSIREGLEELGDAELILGTSDIRWGLTHMPPRAELDTLVGRTRAIVEPAVDYLSEVQLDPLARAAANASDNLARDEIVGTVAVILILATVVWIAGGYLVTVWIRRGLPSFLGRAWMRVGVRTFPAWYAAHGGDVEWALGLGEASVKPPESRTGSGSETGDSGTGEHDEP